MFKFIIKVFFLSFCNSLMYLLLLLLCLLLFFRELLCLLLDGSMISNALAPKPLFLL